MLWRVSAYCPPGFPSPTMSFIRLRDADPMVASRGARHADRPRIDRPGASTAMVLVRSAGRLGLADPTGSPASLEPSAARMVPDAGRSGRQPRICRSSARIAASSPGSAWSQPQMWSVPWTTSSRSSSAADQRTSPVWPPRPTAACSIARSTETTTSPRCRRWPGGSANRGAGALEAGPQPAGTTARPSDRCGPCGSR